MIMFNKSSDQRRLTGDLNGYFRVPEFPSLLQTLFHTAALILLYTLFLFVISPRYRFSTIHYQISSRHIAAVIRSKEQNRFSDFGSFTKAFHWNSWQHI